METLRHLYTNSLSYSVTSHYYLTEITALDHNSFLPQEPGYIATLCAFNDFLHVSLFFFAIAKIQRIGHDHQAPFWLVVLYCNLGISSGNTRRKQATTWPIYLGPPIFLQILNLLISD